MTTKAEDITFIIPGQSQPTTSGAAVRGSVKASVRVGARRGGGEAVRVTARPGDDVVVLSIANGPTLVLHPQDARDLMFAQSAATTRGGAATAGNEVTVPAQLGWPGLEATATRGATRGWMGQVWLSAVEVITGVVKDEAVSMVSAAVTKKLDGRVEAGVYELARDALVPLKGSGRKRDAIPTAPNGAPLLVFVHGTFVDTASTFGKLWALHPQTVQRLFTQYGDRVYALDHPTLGESPIANALRLARVLPDNAKLHLVTHSRGGVVAEVVARLCGAVVSGVDLQPQDVALFKDTKDADYAQHRADLQALVKVVKEKHLRVDRIVRVACPARGALLASKRLDAYLSVLKWGLELASVPVAPELVDFLSEVARRRANPAELPGLEAMMPDSPVVKWLNSPAEPIPGQLRVVAGDIEGDSILSWVKTLMSDAFYWTDNDLVVQTRSMYGGTPRAEQGASFVLDRGGKVTHFSYFANALTVNAIADALTTERPTDFRLIGPLSWAGQDASGTRAARAVARSRSGVPAERPAVFVLPGILGSNLALDGKRVWLSLRFFNSLKKMAWNPDEANRVTDDGPIGMIYDDLIEHLADTHEVILFGFDWRRPIEDEATRLGTAVDAALDARNASQQPVRIVAHSMGGVLARTMRLERADVWQRMLARDGARVLMLGTPNGGSWAPMQVLSGDDTFGNMLATFGSLFDDHGAREVMANMPGFIQLQAALLDTTLGLAQSDNWKALADEDVRRLRERNFWHSDERQLEVYRWGIPPQSVLKRAVELRKRLDAQVAELSGEAPKLLLVVGHARFTPAAIRITDDGLEYLDATDDGDGRVTLDSAMLPGVRTWKVDASHGSLPDESSAFAAYVELLTRGDTDRLPRVQPGAGRVRGEVGRDEVARGLVPSRPSRGRRSSEPPSIEAELFGPAAGADIVPARKQAALRVSVVNGNLKFVSQPLMLGHYLSTILTGTESLVDGLIGGVMKESLSAGLYPTGIGTHQVFLNTWRDPEQVAMPRPRAVVIVGLGEEGRLRMADLSQTVRQGVIAHAQRESEHGAGGPTGFELAATMIGSGGTGVSVGSAAQAIAKGVLDGNDRLDRNGWPRVTHLYLVELYLDRAAEAQHALAVLSDAHPTRYALTPTIVQGTGPLRRPPDSSYRGANYDFVTAVQRRDEQGQPTIEYILDTQRARSEVRGQATQPRLVDELVRVGADSNSTDVQIRRSLFQLLIPVEIEPFMSGSNAMVLQLDTDTARIPWELLDTRERDDTGGSEHYPWAVRTRVLRKLLTVEFRENPVGARSEGGLLVIGEPKCDLNLYAELPAAREEATSVARALGTDPRLGLDALQAVNALLAEDWRIVHIAGHGEHREDGTGGVVLSNGTMLGPREINAMHDVPELVFINCCFIGQVGPQSTAKASGLGALRARFAASVSEQLIRIGVRCVVAAGWAVEDGPAKTFAVRFYERLLAGERFIDAVGAARLAAWDERPAGNTWAAYQCYGDPDWRYKAKSSGGTASTSETPIVSAHALALVLETAALDAQYRDTGKDAKLRRQQRLEWIRHLEAHHAPRWGAAGAVAEAFGLAYANHDDLDAAIRWYGNAVDAIDGSGSFKTAEQLGNLLARRGSKRSNLADGRREIADAIDRLERLVAVTATSERESLLGSAWKLKAVVEEKDQHNAEALRALEQSVHHYRQAEDLALKCGADNLFYPAMNAMAVELRLGFLQGTPAALARDRVAATRQSLEAKTARDPDFWSAVGLAELQLLEALAAGQLTRALPATLERWRDLKARVNATWMWDSVLKQARFTVEPYRNQAALREKKAADDLLNELAKLAAG